MKVSFSNQPVETPVSGVSIPCPTTVCAVVGGPVIDVQAEVVTPPAVAPAAEIPTAAATVSTTAVVVVPPAPVAAPSDTPIECDDNDIRFEDVYLPRINIVQRVGDLSLIYNPGEIVLNQTQVIHVPANVTKKIVGDPPLNITVIGFKRKQFAEKVSGNAQGLLVNTEAEVVAKGGTLAYKEWKQSREAAKTNPAALKKYFQPFSTALLLIERPAALKDEGDIQFPYESEGKHYALALWGMKGTSYTHAAKHFFTARKLGHLKIGYTARAWTFTTQTEKFIGDNGAENFAEIPVVRPGESNSQIFRDFVNEVIGCAGN